MNVCHIKIKIEFAFLSFFLFLYLSVFLVSFCSFCPYFITGRGSGWSPWKYAEEIGLNLDWQTWLPVRVWWLYCCGSTTMNGWVFITVFHSLLKAHAIEARSVVRQALEILTPSMPVRMEDGNTMLTHWTKKIIVEEGHSVQQLFHILQLVVRHYKVRDNLQLAVSQNNSVPSSHTIFCSTVICCMKSVSGSL